jgi:hypothetical protein
VPGQHIEQNRRCQRLAGLTHQIGDLGEIDCEEKHMRDIDLPGSAQDMRTGYHKAALAHLPAIHECRGIARYEHEDLGRIAEAIIADGDPGDEIGGNMGEK